MDMQTKIDPAWAWQPYQPDESQPWDEGLAAHLYRRAGFGADSKMLHAAVKRDPSEVVDNLILRNSQPNEFRSAADGLTDTILATGNPKRLSAAWVYRLLQTPSQLLEKMTLFWHGHFATSADKVKDPSMMWDQNKLLRHHALGDFSALVQSIACDPAMLVYLDSAINRKAHPNENFARELMELFCLGEGNYSEQDVQQLARCFTGWEIKNKKFRKNRYQQDVDEKTILGQRGRFDGEEGVQVVLKQPSLEVFLAKKLCRFFVADSLEPSDKLLQPLAELFRGSNLQIAPVVKMMLSSNLFFSSHAVGQKIRSPVELVIGALRCLQATTNSQLVADGLLKAGQGLFYPPNVKGWDGGRSWINSSTLLERSNLVSRILENDATRFGGLSLDHFLQSQQVNSVHSAIDYFERLLLAVRLDDSVKSLLYESVASGTQKPDRKYRALLRAFLSLPQCQIG